MNTKFATFALSLGLLMSAAGSAAGEGTYVYGDGTTKDYAAGVPVPAPMPVPMQDARWYVRFDIGGSIVGDVDINTVGVGTIPRDSDDIPTSIFGEVGFGYRFNKNFRMDFTSNFHDSYALTDPSNQTFVGFIAGVDAGDNVVNRYNVERRDEVDVRQQSTNLVNAYFDIDNGSRFTPYLGAGIGVSYVNTVRRTTETAVCDQASTNGGGFVDACNTNVSPVTISTNLNQEEHDWVFSGALMAGFSYDVNEYIAMDAGYRLLYNPGEIVRSAPTLNTATQVTWEDFLHHQFRTGIRLKIY